MLRRFIQLESFGGILLFLTALIAIAMDNSAASGIYTKLLHYPLVAKHSALIIINDALMAVYFLLVSLEVKREIYAGSLQHRAQLALPLVGAIGGMLVPACIYIGLNWHQPVYLKGWAIPCATDIAFSLGLLSLFGKYLPSNARVFLSALAIIDDIFSILIIALFYTQKLSFIFLLLSALLYSILWILNRNGVRSLIPYLIIGSLLWLTVLKSGVHATIAGVLLATTIPFDHQKHSPLLKLENAIHPWCVYFILPVFAFANAGFSMHGLHPHIFLHSLPLGILLGLFLGKQAGIFASCTTLLRFKLAKLPEGLTLSHLYGVSLLCGIGFTMSLFIGTLAFSNNPEFASLVRMGVFAGSLLSGLAGGLWLMLSKKKK